MESLLPGINPFWIWLGLACIFLAIEVIIAPSGFFLCLGTAAAIVALVVLIAPELPWLWTLTLFAALSVIASWAWWQLVRKKLNRDKERGEEDQRLNVKTRQLIGYRAVLTQDIKAGRGRLRVNDSPWPVEADSDYPAGTRVEVVEVNGITLKIRAVEE